MAKYKDIIQVEVNHKVFSSSDEVGGIMINDAPKGMERTSFIRMDPPEHDEQRREVSSTVNPVTLAKMEDLIRDPHQHGAGQAAARTKRSTGSSTSRSS